MCGVVYVADDVVRVVVALPPAQRQAQERTHDGPDLVVKVEVVCHARVAEVVPDPGKLLPEDAHARRADHVGHGGSTADDVEGKQQRHKEPREDERAKPGSGRQASNERDADEHTPAHVE